VQVHREEINLVYAKRKYAKVIMYKLCLMLFEKLALLDFSVISTLKNKDRIKSLLKSNHEAHTKYYFLLPMVLPTIKYNTP